MNGASRASLLRLAPLATPVVLSITDNVGVTNAPARFVAATNSAVGSASANRCTRPLAPAAMASTAACREPTCTTASLPRVFAAATTEPSTSFEMDGIFKPCERPSS